MADLLEQAASWLTDQRTKFMSRTVLYSRGTVSVAVQATVGQTMFEVDDGNGMVETWRSRDFLVAAAALVLNGTVVTPQRGDRIADAGKVYEVMAPGKEHVFRWSDPYGVTLRIHTKQVQ